MRYFAVIRSMDPSSFEAGKGAAKGKNSYVQRVNRVVSSGDDIREGVLGKGAVGNTRICPGCHSGPDPASMER